MRFLSHIFCAVIFILLCGCKKNIPDDWKTFKLSDGNYVYYISTSPNYSSYYSNSPWVSSEGIKRNDDRVYLIKIPYSDFWKNSNPVVSCFPSPYPPPISEPFPSTYQSYNNYELIYSSFSKKKRLIGVFYYNTNFISPGPSLAGGMYFYKRSNDNYYFPIIQSDFAPSELNEIISIFQRIKHKKRI